MKSEGYKAVAIMGATGVGKSALALRLAKTLGTSIITCDSMQLYQGLDIGTAKPSADDQQQAPHFLIDMLTLPDTCSAMVWVDAAAKAIHRENQAGRVPLIVGGTGLYLKALVEGLADIPDEKPEVRQQLMEMAVDEKGLSLLYAELRQADPETAARLKAHDQQRIVRALGVYRSSGVPLSAWLRKPVKKQHIQCSVYALDMDRTLLRQRLKTRFQQMMTLGLLDETHWLASLKLAETHPAMRAVGYRQLLGYLYGKTSLQQAVDDGITATRRYAKRQRTWLRHQTHAIWGDASSVERAIDLQLRQEDKNQ
ncbi:MAG: tRNA (adenosine(37)-N6)-dimethylallyltransferase MiaA [Mariprofundaceae bacterium]